jgi:hypothetical protein
MSVITIKPSAFRAMPYEQFVREFRPVKNEVSKNPSYDWTMFETHGTDSEYVQQVNKERPSTVWTIIEGEGGVTIANGMLLANRAGYLITEVPASTGTTYDIVVEEFEEEE